MYVYNSFQIAHSRVHAKSDGGQTRFRRFGELVYGCEERKYVRSRDFVRIRLVSYSSSTRTTPFFTCSPVLEIGRRLAVPAGNAEAPRGPVRAARQSGGRDGFV